MSTVENLNMKIYEAASTNNISFVKESLAGDYGEIPDSDLELALLRASCNGHLECVTLLLDSGVSVLSKDGSEDIALMLASQRGHTDVVNKLIQYKSPVNYQNSLGYTALMRACENGHVKVAEILLQNGADESSLSEGREEGIVETRIRRDIPHGYTPLMVTVLNQASGYKDLMKLLLRAKVDVNEEDLEGSTVLHHAAKRCDSEDLAILLNAEANINSLDIWGVTPLMNACAYNKVDNVKLLLQQGADVTFTCKAGRTCLLIAARTASVEIITMLLAAGADADHRDAHRSTPIFIAMSHQNYSAMKCFLQIGCDLSVSCYAKSSFTNKITLFQYAMMRADTQMMKMLYLAGACNNRDLYIFCKSEKLLSQCQDKPEVFEMLHNIATNPRSLLGCCRLSVRKAISHSIPTGINSLTLPKALKDYLLYSDITLES